MLRADGWKANGLMPAADICACAERPSGLHYSKTLAAQSYTSTAQKFLVFTIATRYLCFYRGSFLLSSAAEAYRDRAKLGACSVCTTPEGHWQTDTLSLPLPRPLPTAILVAPQKSLVPEMPPLLTLQQRASARPTFVPVKTHGPLPSASSGGKADLLMHAALLSVGTGRTRAFRDAQLCNKSQPAEQPRHCGEPTPHTVHSSHRMGSILLGDTAGSCVPKSLPSELFGLKKKCLKLAEFL